MPNFTKISPAGAELLHVDGRTDMTKLVASLATRLKFAHSVDFAT